MPLVQVRSSPSKIEVRGLRRKEKLLTVCQGFPGIFTKQLARIVSIGVIGYILSAPIERVDDAIVVTHREMPFPVVHVAFEHD